MSTDSLVSDLEINFEGFFREPVAITPFLISLAPNVT